MPHRFKLVLTGMHLAAQLAAMQIADNLSRYDHLKISNTDIAITSLRVNDFVETKY